MAVPRLDIRIVVEGSDAIRAIEYMEARLAQLEQPLLEMGAMWSVHMVDNFHKGIFSWPPLKASTIKKKASMGVPLVPLYRTGALRQAVQGAQWHGSGGGGKFLVGLELPAYSKFHMDGFQHVGGSFVPARDFTEPGDTFVEEAFTILMDWILPP